ncbi:MAG: thiamine-phosphate kinase [Pseudomonadota bacterium]
MNEFDIISKYFTPLAQYAGAADLSDDVAELVIPSGARVVVTTDALVEGVHFLPGDPLDTVARKLLRVNVSDCLAKGAKPLAASLTLAWPATRAERDLAAFAAGLDSDLAHWDVALLGGDTVSTPGPLTLSLTLHGVCGQAGPIRRSGGHAGEDLWVTGSIGDGFLGLRAAQGDLASVSAVDCARLSGVYRTPAPPELAFAAVVANFASASVDVSDGLIADLQHLAEASGLGATLNLSEMPVSEAAARWLASQDENTGRLLLATGGDDYQTLFSAPPSLAADIVSAAKAAGVAATRIGTLNAKPGVFVLDASGMPLNVDRAGWAHFSAQS